MTALVEHSPVLSASVHGFVGLQTRESIGIGKSRGHAELKLDGNKYLHTFEQVISGHRRLQQPNQLIRYFRLASLRND